MKICEIVGSRTVLYFPHIWLGKYSWFSPYSPDVPVLVHCTTQRRAIHNTQYVHAYGKCMLNSKLYNDIWLAFVSAHTYVHITMYAIELYSIHEHSIYGTWHGKLNFFWGIPWLFRVERRGFSARVPQNFRAGAADFPCGQARIFHAGGRGSFAKTGTNLPCGFGLKWRKPEGELRAQQR